MLVLLSWLLRLRGEEAGALMFFRCVYSLHFRRSVPEKGWTN